MDTALIECLRFSGDFPAASASEDELLQIATQYGERELAHCLVSSLEISRKATPEVFERIDRVAKKLGGVKWRGFIQAGTEHRASCFRVRLACDSEDTVVVLMSSQIVRDYSDIGFRFVVGHELGHAVLGHHGYPGADSASSESERVSLLDLSRSSEFSADRIGLFLSGNALEAIRSCVQLASGLAHTQVSMKAGEHYLNQLEEIGLGPMGVDLESLTHPPLPLRALNLLRTARAIKESEGSFAALEDRMREVDQVIFEAIGRIRASSGFESANKWVDLATYWAVVAYFAADNRLSANEQAWIEEKFGPRRLEGALRFVTKYRGDSTNQALSLFAQQCVGLRDSRQLLANQVKAQLELASKGAGQNGFEKRVLDACLSHLGVE